MRCGHRLEGTAGLERQKWRGFEGETTSIPILAFTDDRVGQASAYAERGYGYKLMNDARSPRAVQRYHLGHKNFQHTEPDNELLPERFKSFWVD